jgi:hypothetical protein
MKKYSDADQSAIDAIPEKFWQTLKKLPPMRKATYAELRQLNWCEAAGLLYHMKICGFHCSDSWSQVLRNLRVCNRRGVIHVGHIPAILKTRTTPPNQGNTTV